MNETLGLKEARYRFGERCRSAAARRDRTTITDHGHTLAVLISADELAELEQRAGEATTPAITNEGRSE